MAFSLDSMLEPKPVSGQTYAISPNASYEEQKRSLVYKEVKGENNKPYQAMNFKGVVLYTSILTYGQFLKKYNKLFVQFCTGKSLDAEGDSAQTSKIKIVEAIVYVKELCSCLPQPADAEFLRKIKEIGTKKGNSLEKLRKESKSNSKVLKQLNQIERYPKAYAAVGLSGDKANEISPKMVVDVSFPHQFDFSYAAIVRKK